MSQKTSLGAGLVGAPGESTQDLSTVDEEGISNGETSPVEADASASNGASNAPADNGKADTPASNGAANTVASNGATATPATSIRARATRKKTRKVLKVVQRGGSSIRRPQKTEWYRTRPDWVEDVYLIEDQGDTYVTTEEVAEALGDRCSEGTLHGAVNLLGDVFLLPVKDGDTQASSSLAEAVETAEDEWVQSRWKKSEGRYTCDTPDKPVDDPVWPNRSWDDVFDSSVKSRFIDSVEHEVIQRILYAQV